MRRRLVPKTLVPTRRSPFVRLELLEARETPALFNVLSPVTPGAATANYGCIATGDFNGDHKLDMVMTNYGTTSPGQAAQSGGLITPNPGKTISILLGNGDGTFGPQSTITIGNDQYVSFVAVGDLNGDNKLDLAVVSNDENANGRLSIYLGNGSGGFALSAQGAIPTGSSNACWVGITQLTSGDTNPDVVVCGFGTTDNGQTTILGNAITLFQGDGTGAVANIGTVTNGLSFIPTSLAIADFNGDGKMDIAATVPGVPPDETSPQPAGTVQMFTGNGSGGFTASTSFSSGGALPINIQVANLNGDTQPDLVIANAGDPDASNFYANFGLNSAMGVAINAGGMNFNTTSYTAGLGQNGSKSVFAVTVSDFDLDTKPDIAAVVYGNPLSGANAHILEFKGDGNGGFTADANSPFNTTTTGGQYLVGVPVDTNSNTTPDVIYSTDSGRYGVMLNTTTPAVTTTTTVNLPTNPTTAPYGPMTFTATVSGGVPDGGTVTFFRNGTAIGTGTTTGGTATFSTTVLGNNLVPVSGTAYSITAAYAGVSGFSASNSNTSPVSLTITQAVTQTTASGPVAPVTQGNTAALIANVTFTPTGGGGNLNGMTVNFIDGTTTVGSGTLDSTGAVTVNANTGTWAVGPHTIFARLIGNSNIAGSDSSTFMVTITASGATATTTGVTSNALSGAVYTQPVTFTATVSVTSGSPPTTGSVTFFDNGIQIGNPVNLSGSNQATLQVNNLSVTTHPITAVFNGTAGYSASPPSPTFNQVVTAANTSTALATGVPGTSVVGQSVSFTATVSATGLATGPVNTGSVQFYDGAAPIGAAVGVNGSGQAVLITSFSTPVTHTITAQYTGSSNFVASLMSSGVTQQVNQIGTSTTLGLGSPSTSVVGQSVSFTASVTVTGAGTGPVNAGSVQFFDNGSPFGAAVAVNGSGQAVLQTSALGLGGHTITAQYTGSTNFAASPTSTGVSQQVNQIGTTTNLAAGTPNPSVIGQSVSFTATVSVSGAGTGPVNAGSVQFFNNGSPIGSPVAVSGSGQATLQTSALGLGGHTITAQYTGSTNFASSPVSSGVSQQVNQITTATSLSAGTPNPSTVGQSVSFTATVSVTGAGTGPVNTGSVQFFDGGSPIGGPVGVNGSGQAGLTTTTLMTGPHTITAQYTGSTNFAVSAVSNSVTQTVNTAGNVTTSTAVVSSGPSYVTQMVTFTATVSAAAGTAQGSVTFFDGSTPLGTVGLTPVAGGNPTASLPVSSLSVGTHTITAGYNPNTGFAGSSGLTSQTVSTVPTSVSLSANPTSAAPGVNVTLTAQIGPAISTGLAPTGTVTFMANGSPIGTVAAGAGPLSLTTPNLPAGTDTVTAVYGGDGTFAGSTSGGVTVTIAAPQLTGEPIVVSGPPTGAAVVYDPTGGKYTTSPVSQLNPFGFVPASVRSAVADVNGDGIPDFILVTGPGTPARVAVVSGKDSTTLLVPPTDPFGGDFTGGAFVTAGDLNGDGRAEWVVTPDQGGGPNVVIFTLRPDGTVPQPQAFFALGNPGFRGGARPAMGDVNKDGVPDLAIAAGFLGGPNVEIHDGKSLAAGDTTTLIGGNGFFAFPEDAATLRNGVFLTIGDVDGDGFGDLIFGGGPGGGPRVVIFSGARLTARDIVGANANPLSNFFFGDDSNRGGVRLAAVNMDGDNRADLVVASGEGVASRVRVYPGKAFTGPGEPGTFQDLDPFGEVEAGGVFVG
jgi:hypothetical protein